MWDIKQWLAVAATLGLFSAICIVLRTRGARVVGSACIFVASLTSVQLAVSQLGKAPFRWRHPGFLTTVHFACVWIGCAGYFVWRGEARKVLPCSIGAMRWVKNILPYALCMPISVVLNNEGILHAGPGLVAIIGTLSPIVTALVSRFFGRKIACVSWFGILVAMVGGAIISRAEFEDANGGKRGVLYGMVCALLSVAGRAFKIVISDWLLSPGAYSGSAKDSEPPLSFMHIYVLEFSAGDLATLIFAFFLERAEGAVEAWQSLDWSVILMILLTCIPATILNFTGGLVLRELGAPLQQLVGKLNTLVIAAISMAFLGEHLSHEVLLGTCFVLVGVTIFEYGIRLEEEHPSTESDEEDDSSDNQSNEGTDSDSERGRLKIKESVTSRVLRADSVDTSASESEGDDCIYSRYPPARRLRVICTGRLSQIILLTALWWSAAIYVTLMFKMTTSSEDGEVVLPGFVLTFLVNTCTGFIAWALTLVLPCEGVLRPCDFQRPEWLKIVVLGVVTGCEMGCLNKSLEYLSISERTFFQNANVLFTMIAAQFLGLESLTGARLLAGFLLACGGVLQAFACKEQHEQAEQVAQAAHLQGMVFMVCSMLLTSVKFTLIQLMTQRSPPTSALGRMSKLQLAALVQPITGLICVALAAFFEMDALRHILDSRDILLRALWISFAITLIICTELKLVELTSAVTCGVLVNLHHIPIVITGIILFNEPIQQNSWHGFALCILGGCLYVYARSLDKESRPSE